MNLPRLFNQSPADQQLMQAAQRQYDGGDYREALVLSHIAIEVAADQTLAAWAGEVEPAPLRPWLLKQIDTNHNLGSTKIRALFEAMSGREISSEDFWAAFITFNELRNRIMHEGIAISQEQARGAITNAETMLTYLASNMPQTSA